MRKGLFIFGDSLLASNYSGAASRALQNFQALRELCDELHVLRLCSPNRYSKLMAFEQNSLEGQEAKGRATSWEDLRLDTRVPRRSYLQLFLESLLAPMRFEYPNLAANSRQLGERISALGPDFLWVEHSDLAALVQNLDLNIPWVYSHLDILHHIRQIRYPARSFRDRWFLWVCERVEKQIDRAPTAIVTASSVEARWLKRARQGAAARHVFMVPMAYQGEPTLIGRSSSSQVRIIHLGSLETTANRVGLTGYLEKVHESLASSLRECGLSCELWVIGDTSSAKPYLMDLLRHSGAIMPGYVGDLQSIFRPYDIAILPYEFDSGFRTKLPLFFKFYQVVVATRKSVAGTDLEGLENVCVLTDTVKDFIPVIRDLVRDHRKRMRLAWKAADFYRNCFRFDTVLPLYQQVLELM
jgi:hypothetical protein